MAKTTKNITIFLQSEIPYYQRNPAKFYGCEICQKKRKKPKKLDKWAFGWYNGSNPKKIKSCLESKFLTFLERKMKPNNSYLFPNLKLISERKQLIKK